MLTKLVQTIARDREITLFVERVVIPVAVTSALNWIDTKLSGSGSGTPSGGGWSASSGSTGFEHLF